MMKCIQDMTADEKFSASLQLEWDLDLSSHGDGKLHHQFTSFENFVACRQRERWTHVRILRQRGMTAEEEQKYVREWQASSALQEEFTDMKTYVAYRAAEERQLIGTGGR